MFSSPPALAPNYGPGAPSHNSTGNKMPAGSEWSSEEDETLIQGRRDGLSAAQIALRLPLRSRNSVIGRANRLDLPPLENCSALRARVQRKNEKPKTGRTPPPAKAPSLPKDPSLAADLAPTFYDPPYETCLTFGQIKNSCRYPIQDRFCPFEKTHGSYCSHHYRITHLKSSASRRPYVAMRREAA
jgi:hypothetical protein